MIRSVFILSMLCSIGACTDRPSKQQCEQLLDNVLAIYAPQKGDESEAAQENLKKQQEAVRDQVGETFLSECMDTLPAAQVQCSLKARSQKDLAACEEPS